MTRVFNRHSAATMLMGLWALCFAKVVRAATLSEFMGGYDAQLLQWAAATAVLGGMIRTILSLESDKRVIKDILKTAAGDAFKALVAGLFMFICVQALRSWGMAIPSEVRFTAVLVAGWHRVAALVWLFKSLLEVVEALKAKVIATSPSTKETP